MATPLSKTADIVMTLDSRKKVLSLHAREANAIDIVNAFANVCDLFYDSLSDRGMSKDSISAAMMTQLTELNMRKS